MRWLWITLGTVVLLGVLFVGGIFGVSETGGEVVVLETLDAGGAPHETRLWVVDDGGDAWLRSGQPTSSWLLRIDENPRVRVPRGRASASYRAEPVHDPAVRDRIHARMAEKYGFADELWSRFADRDRSVPIRLQPLGTAAAVP